MPRLIVTTRDGDERAVEASPGFTVMEVLRNNGFDEVLALCGGCRSCATCHVYVDPKFANRLAPMSADERDLLESSEHRTANSRLSCQIPFTDDLDELHVTVALAD